MFGIIHYGTFIVSFIVLLILPGPGNFALITSTGKGGIKAGLAAISGVLVGDQILLWLAVAGVAAVLQTYPAAFHIVQIVGGLYLAYLGFKLLRSRSGSGPVVDIKPYHYLRQTLVITLLNPKAVLFYMAFLPLFIDPDQHQGFITFGVLAVTVSCLTFLYGLIVIGLTYFCANQIKSNQAIALAFQRVAGVFLIGFGVKLLASN
ncbi:LysE family transporter [Pseudomonas lutea]|uniref:LysE family transporter n=1 Tax=Pseudomonas lutea TaxID=243924 RepID=A0ABR9AAF7_9PSED|nr:LysE family transporter [Pseudomonas lutea]MBD8122920.1 LysE family transporter [Pseudomonas lutea]